MDEIEEYAKAVLPEVYRLNVNLSTEEIARIAFTIAQAMRNEAIARRKAQYGG